MHAIEPVTPLLRSRTLSHLISAGLAAKAARYERLLWRITRPSRHLLQRPGAPGVIQAATDPQRPLVRLREHLEQLAEDSTHL
jgi:hypothetical protein